MALWVTSCIPLFNSKLTDLKISEVYDREHQTCDVEDTSWMVEVNSYRECHPRFSPPSSLGRRARIPWPSFSFLVPVAFCFTCGMARTVLSGISKRGFAMTNFLPATVDWLVFFWYKWKHQLALSKRIHALGHAGLAIFVDLSQAVVSLNHGREDPRSN